MKHINRIILILIIIVLVFFCGCSKKDIYIDDLEGDLPLIIYSYLYDNTEEMIDRYNAYKPDSDREIEVILFEDEKEMYDKILYEMSTGGGPDIIVLDGMTSYYIDIHKLAQSGAFADMDILIGNSQTFNIDDYNKEALDAGILSGKRVFIPTYYTVPYWIGAKENFDYYGCSLSDDFTFTEYFDILNDYYMQSDKTAAINSHQFYIMLAQSEHITIGQSIEKTDELIRFFENSKTEYQRHVDGKGITNKYFPEYLDEFMEEKLLFMWKAGAGAPLYNIHEEYNMIANYLSAEIIVSPMPSKEGSPQKAYTEYGLAININSKQKNESFKFVEYALSYSVQSTTLFLHGFPVNNKAYDIKIEDFYRGYGARIQYQFDMQQTEIPMDIRKDYIEFVESSEIYEFSGFYKYIYYNLMLESLKDYWNDRVTLDEMIDELNNKLSIYYTE